MKDLFAALMQEIYNGMGESPYIVPIPFEEHERVPVELRLRKDTLDMIHKLAKMYNLSHKQIMECLINGVGRYLGEKSEGGN